MSLVSLKKILYFVEKMDNFRGSSPLYLDIVSATYQQCSVKFIENHPPPAAVAGLEDVQGLEGFLTENPLPLYLFPVQREELVSRSPAVEATQTVLESDQHDVAGVQDPAELHQHPLQLLHLHGRLQGALQVGLDGEDEVLYLDGVNLDRTLGAGPEIWVWRGQQSAGRLTGRIFLQTGGALDTTGQTAGLPGVPAPDTPTDKQLAGQQRVLPADCGGQQLRVADGDLLPRPDPPDGEGVHHQVVAVVVDILLG